MAAAGHSGAVTRADVAVRVGERVPDIEWEERAGHGGALRRGRQK